MRIKYFGIVSLLLGYGAIGCGGEVEDPGTAQQAVHSDLHKLKDAFKKATAAYHDLDNAEADGFIRLQEECFVEETPEGVISPGVVYVNPGRMNAIIDKTLPEVLFYEPQADGSLELAGGEYFCPGDACTSAPAPLFNQEFEFEEGTQGWAIHVWAWLDNPNGLTEFSNPNLDLSHCP